MATYIKGTPVENATAYELYQKIGDSYTKIAEQAGLEFNLDELISEPGDYTLFVKAKADGYEDSDYSNEIFYKVSTT